MLLLTKALFALPPAIPSAAVSPSAKQLKFHSVHVGAEMINWRVFVKHLVHENPM